MKEIEIIINGDKLERVKRILSAFSKNGIFVSQGLATVISRATIRCTRAMTIVA